MLIYKIKKTFDLDDTTHLRDGCAFAFGCGVQGLSHGSTPLWNQVGIVPRHTMQVKLNEAKSL